MATNLRSLQFTAASSQALSRAMTVGNRQVFTISCWLKRASIASQHLIAGFGDDAGPTNAIWFGLDSSNRIFFNGFSGGVANGTVTSTNTITDTTTWHHLLLAVNTTQATAANRVHIYLDGAEVAYTTATYPTLNANLHTTGTWYWGRLDTQALFFLNGLLDEAYYVEGAQLTPSSFWSAGGALIYTGSFGTAGFNLRFENSASLGADSGPNGLTWSTVNMSVANSSTDVPALSQTPIMSSAIVVGPTYRHRVQYQARAEPVLRNDMRPEAIHIQWMSPLSEPVRGRDGRFATTEREQAQVHLHPPFNSMTFFAPQMPEAVTADRWQQPWSIPERVKLKLLPEALRANLLGQPPPNTADFVPPDRYLYPWSEPVRPKGGLATGLHQTVARTGAAPFENFLADKYGYSFSEPVRVPTRILPAAQQFTAFFGQSDPPVVVQHNHFPSGPLLRKESFHTRVQTLAWNTFTPDPPPQFFQDKWADPVQITAKWTTAPVRQSFSYLNNVTVDQWIFPWSDPVRRVTQQHLQPYNFYFETQQFPELVTIDRFHSPFSLPVRRPPNQSLYAPQANEGATSYAPTVIFLDKWYRPWLNRYGKWGIYQATEYVGAVLGTVELTSPDKWYMPWTNPRAASVTVVQHQIKAPGGPEVFFGPDKWMTPFSEPVRLKPGLRPALHQSNARTGADPFPERIFMDKWFSHLSMPNTLVKRGEPSHQQMTARVGPVDFVFPVIQYPAWSEPPRRRVNPLPPAQHQFLALTKADPFPEATTTDRYRPEFPDILRRVPSRASYVEGFVWLGELVFPDKWFRPLSEPVRRVSSHALQPYQFYFETAQFPEVVTADKWLFPWSIPQRLQKPYLLPGLHQTVARTGAAPFPEVMDYSKYQHQWSVPVRLPPKLLPAAQSFFFMQPQKPGGTALILATSDLPDSALFVASFRTVTTNRPVQAVVTISEIEASNTPTSISET